MIFIGSDHAGFNYKKEIINFLEKDLNQKTEDVGCFSPESVDYPDIAKSVGNKVIENNALGILICGSGIGMSIAANKVKGIRCALCCNEYSAEMTRKHNNSNILALGERVIGIDIAKSIVKKFIAAEFEGGRHKIRVDKIENLS